MSSRPLLVAIAGIASLIAVGAAQAQPRAASPDQFGDRQAGHFGDPGEGHFGDPSKGNFDDARMKQPAPGAEPQGRVYKREGANGPAYVTLPAPVATATPVAKPATTASTATKPKSAKKARRKARAAG